VSNLPPAGWYDDPEYAGHLRYWSGDAWSEHRSEKSGGTRQVGATGLSDVSDWLNQTFRVLWQRRVPMLTVALANLVISAVAAVVVARLWGDLLWDGQHWTGFSAGRVWATVALLLGAGWATAVWQLAACHQLYHCRLGNNVPLRASMAASLRALPRALGWLLALAATLVVAVGIVVFLGAVNVGLGLLGMLALLVGAIWAAVKLAFLAPALVIRIEGRNPIEASADVSRSRFWPVVGRLLLLAVVSFGVSVGFSLITAPFTSTDAEAIEGYFLVEQDEVVRADIGGVIEEMNLAGPASILATLPGVVTTLVGLAATSALFAETFQVRPESAAVPEAGN